MGSGDRSIEITEWKLGKGDGKWEIENCPVNCCYQGIKLFQPPS